MQSLKSSISDSSFYFHQERKPSREKARNILQRLQPLSLPYSDREGRIIQLWRSEKGLIGGVLDLQGRLKVIPGNKILNPLTSNQNPEDLLFRLEKIGLRRWDLVFLAEKMEIVVWPHLIAAGRNGTMDFSKQPHHFTHMFRQGHDAHYSQDTAQNREKIKYVAENGDYAGRIIYNGQPTKVYHLRDVKNPAGQHWAYVREDTHEIVNGGFATNKYQKLVPDPKKPGFCMTETFSSLETRMNRLGRQLPGRLKGFDNELKKDWYQRIQQGKNTARSLALTPALKQFKETLQQTKLTDSYNSTHRHNPIEERSGVGSDIGGVACSVDYFEGLFDSLEALFESDHCFFLKLFRMARFPFQMMNFVRFFESLL